MRYGVRFSPKAEKEFKKLPNRDQKRVSKGLFYLETDPFSGKKLKGEFKGFFSLRVWPYRIIYAIIEVDLVIIIRVGHRKDVYD